MAIKQTFFRKLKNGVSVTGSFDSRTKLSSVTTRFKNGVKKITTTKIVGAKKSGIGKIAFRAGQKSGKY